MNYQPHSQYLNLLSMIRYSHLQGIRQTRALNLSVNKLKYAVAAAACAYARMLAENDEKRTEFYDEPFWHDQQRFHRNKDLLHVMMYIEDAKEGGNYKLASAHSVALQTLCDNTEVPDEELAKHIKDSGGFSGLVEADDDAFDEAADDDADEADQEAALQRPITAPSIFDDEDELSNDEEMEEENDTPDGVDEVARPPVRAPAKPATSVPRLQWAYVELCVLARPAPDDRETILGLLRDDQSVWVKLKPGKRMEYELHKGDGSFIDTMIEEYKVAEQ